MFIDSVAAGFGAMIDYAFNAESEQAKVQSASSVAIPTCGKHFYKFITLHSLFHYTQQ